MIVLFFFKYVKSSNFDVIIVGARNNFWLQNLTMEEEGIHYSFHPLQITFLSFTVQFMIPYFFLFRQRSKSIYTQCEVEFHKIEHRS